VLGAAYTGFGGAMETGAGAGGALIYTELVLPWYCCFTGSAL